MAFSCFPVNFLIEKSKKFTCMSSIKQFLALSARSGSERWSIKRVGLGEILFHFDCQKCTATCYGQILEYIYSYLYDLGEQCRRKCLICVRKNTEKRKETWHTVAEDLWDVVKTACFFQVDVETCFVGKTGVLCCLQCVNGNVFPVLHRQCLPDLFRVQNVVRKLWFILRHGLSAVLWLLN